MAMSENTKRVFRYMQEHNGEDLTAADVAEALGLEKKVVDGAFTSGIQRKGYGVRTPAEAELPDGTHKAIKLLSLTEEGINFDVDAPVEA